MAKVKLVSISDTDPNQIQQGDVTLQRVKKLPKNAVKDRKTPSPVIMEGEGHHVHALDTLQGVNFFTAGDVRFMEVTKPVALKHQGVSGGPGEHDTITVDAGIWQIGQVFEFDPYLNLTRAVID